MKYLELILNANSLDLKSLKSLQKLFENKTNPLNLVGLNLDISDNSIK